MIPLVSLIHRATAATECRGLFQQSWHFNVNSDSVGLKPADFDTQVLAAQQHHTTGTDALIEMRCYMEEKPVPKDQDPLLWWQSHEQAFPSLSRLATKYLGITASSVPSEGIFSKAGELVSQRRNRLKGDHVNVLLFLNKNI